MPGITGIIKKGSSGENAKTLQAMVGSMVHEKFYTSGTYVNTQLGLQLGWSCHKDSFSDCLPIWNETEEICLIFSGEHAVDPSEIEQLKKTGHRFSPGNASYLVHLYEQYGIGFLEKLNGWFSGILIDLREQKTVLFNDRYALNRIYYYENNGEHYFSSEAKSLLKVHPQLRQLNIRNLGEFFSCGCVMGNETLFSGVSTLPGGSMWTFYPDRDVRKETYFKRETWENQPTLSEEEYHKKLKETLARVVPRYLAGPQPVAVSLTGGIDTRMIMAWADCPPLKVPCYTFGGMYRDCADVKVARQVAKACQQRHETITVSRKFFSEFPELAKKTVYYTDGTMDVSGSVELFVNKLAREIAPVRLTGNYGDEVLRSIIGFKQRPLFNGIFNPEFDQLVRTGHSTYDNLPPERSLSFLAFKQVPWSHYARLALERTQLTMRSPYLDNDLVALAYQAPASLATSKELSLRLIKEGNLFLSRIPTDRGVLYRSIPGITNARRFHQEFTFKAEYAYDYGMPQWLARLDHHYAQLRLERMFLGRHKFYHFRVWLRDELSGYVKEILLSQRSLNRPYLDRKCVEKVVLDHTSGRLNYTTEITKLLTIELLQRHLLEKY